MSSSRQDAIADVLEEIEAMTGGNFGDLARATAIVDRLARHRRAMLLPKHICATIKHNAHAAIYEPIATWLEHNANPSDPALCWVEITDEDRAEILRTGELWTIQWYPDTPVGFCAVGAATLERALELASRP